MALRDWLHNNPVSVSVGAVVVLALALAAVLAQSGQFSRSSAGTAYYWHLETGETFTAPSGQMPPIQAPDGGQAVRAHLYSCGPCDSDHWFGYLETYQTQAARQFDGGPAPPAPVEGMLADNNMVRLIEDERWVPFMSPEGEALRERVYSRCANAADLTPCLP